MPVNGNGGGGMMCVRDRDYGVFGGYQTTNIYLSNA